MANAVPDIELTKNKENDISESETMVTTIKVAEAEQPVKIETTKQNFSTLIQKDGTKILLLLYLYFLQGIPLGLSSSIPFLLSIRSISYSDQGTFSFASWPFSIKLLWAPIVDSLYIYKFGRRKSWLIPVQLLIAIFLLCFASSSKSLVESGSSKSDIIFLTSIFFTLNFLAATQDICVDGWAITMLSEENVSWQSTCNNVGQALGIFISGTIFIVLESTSFSNKYIRKIFGLAEQNYGLIDLQSFMIFFGAVFLVTTIIIMVFKNENNVSTGCWCLFKKRSEETKKEEELEDFEHEKINLINTYKTMYRICTLIPIRKLTFFLLTGKIAFAVNSVNFLKLTEAGVTKEVQTLMDIPLTIVSIVWALLISKFTNANKSLIFHLWAILLKIAMSLIMAGFVYFIYIFKDVENNFYWFFYLIYFMIGGLNGIVNTTLFITIVSFYAKVSDQNVGGTYMTLLATLANLGSMFPSTFGMYLVNWLTFKNCSFDQYLNNSTMMNATQFIVNNTTNFDSLLLSNNMTVSSYVNKCSTTELSIECKSVGGQCITLSDPYYYLTGILAIIGLIWIISIRKLTIRLNNLPKSDWSVKKKS